MPKQRHIDSLTLAGLGYLFIPYAIFLFGWFKVAVALPLVIGGLFFLWRVSRRDSPAKVITGARRTEIWVFALLALWTLMSGVGGFIWQNPWDHGFRNALFIDMVTDDWPIVRDGSTVVYYLGFWLPSALVAKVTSSLTAGHVTQLIYAFIGLVLAYRLTSQLIGRVSLKVLAVFILFSGLDIVGAYLTDFPVLPFGEKFGHWNPMAMWECNTLMVFWIYNQAIPAWVGSMLVFYNRAHPAVSILALAFMSISAPFPCVGLALVCAYQLLYKSSRPWRGVKSCLRDIFSASNIYSLVAIIPVEAYFALTRHTESMHIRNFLHDGNQVVLALLLVLLDAAVFIPFIYKQVNDKREFLILLFTPIALLLLQVGRFQSIDFNSRVELPLAFFLTWQVAVYVLNWRKHLLGMKCAFVVIAIFALASPASEIYRTISRCFTEPQSTWRTHAYDTIYDTTICHDNFVADGVTPADSRLGCIFR